MQNYLSLFFLFFLQVGFGQVFCELSQSNDQLGDYPPGCRMCSPVILGNNIGYSPDDSISYDFPCGEVENSVWYSFYSRDQEASLISISVNHCSQDKGIEVGVFDEELNLISECISIANNRSDNINLVLPARELFYIMVDGIDGDECSFNISNSILFEPVIEDISIIPSSSSYCLEAEVCFSRQRDFALEQYEWQVPAEDSIVSGGVNEEEVCLYFKTKGDEGYFIKSSLRL